MKLPVQITFRNMESNDAIAALIREEAAKLETYYDRIIGCRVVVEMPNHRHARGSVYHIRIDLTVPGAELVVKEQPSLHSALRQVEGERPSKQLEVEAPHKNVRQAINDAFNAMRRRLQDYARRQRGDVKTHPPLLRKAPAF